MSLKIVLARGVEWVYEVMNRGFGEVYVAKDRVSNDLVAIKKLRILTDSMALDGESQMLKSCVSKFVVRYCDVVMKENELWVRHL